MSEPSEKPRVLFLRSTSQHFPFDFEPEVAKAGYQPWSFDELEDFLASPAREKPFLAVIEIGHTADIERALIAFEWSEQVQPLAQARYVFLLSSKNLSLGDRAHRFGGAEIVTLPQPARSLLFKLELQSRLLQSPRIEPPKEWNRGFSAQQEEVDDGGSRKRVLVARGQSEKSGEWRRGESSPQGKIRWRWIRNAEATAKPEKEDYSWLAESAAKPTFDSALQAWLLDGKEADLICFRNNAQIYSAQSGIAHARQKNGEPESLSPPASLAQEKNVGNFDTERGGPSSVDKIQGLLKDALHANPKPAEDTPTSVFEGRNAKIKKTAESAPDPAEATQPTQGKQTLHSAPPSVLERQSKANSQRSNDSSHDKKKSDPYVALSARVRSDRRAEGKEPNSEGWQSPAKQADGDAVHSENDEPKNSATVRNPPPYSPESDPFHRSEPVSSFENPTAERNSGRNKPKEEISLANKDARDPAGKTALSAGSSFSQREGSFPLGPNPADTAAPDRPEKIPPHNRAPQDLEQAHSSEKFRSEEASDTSSSPAVAAAPPLGNDSEKATALIASDPLGKSGKAGDPGGQPKEIAQTGDQTKIQVLANPEKKGAASDISTAPSLSLSKDELHVGQGAGRERDQERTRVRGVDPENSNLRSVAASGEASPSEHESRHFLKNRFYMLMTLRELSDEESSWHPVGKYRIYLAAKHRYFGLAQPDHVLPLWVYEGELAPEFVDEKQSWKFYDRLPVATYSLDSLPLELLEHIYKMAGQIMPPEARKQAEGKILSPAAEVPPAASSSFFTPAEIKTLPRGAWSGFVSFLKKIFGG